MNSEFFLLSVVYMVGIVGIPVARFSILVQYLASYCVVVYICVFVCVWCVWCVWCVCAAAAAAAAAAMLLNNSRSLSFSLN